MLSSRGFGGGGGGSRGDVTATFAGCFDFPGVGAGASTAGARSSVSGSRSQARPGVRNGRPGRQQSRVLANQQWGQPAVWWVPGSGGIAARPANQRQSHSLQAGTAGGALQAASGPCGGTVPGANSFAFTAQPQPQPQQQQQQRPRTTNTSNYIDRQPNLAATRRKSSRTLSPVPVTNPPGPTDLDGLGQKINMFGRSASATGGGLSINTGAANSAAGSSSTPAAGGLFGNAAASTQPAASGGLFGGTQTGGGGLFGNKPAAPATGGLFGQSQSATPSQPQQSGGGGLFGSAQPQQQQQQPQQQQSGGLFGSAQPQQQQGGGLFGASQQKPATGGLFGQSSTQPQQQQQQQQPSGGLFGGGNTQPQQNQGAGGGLFGQSQAQNQSKPGGLFGQSQAGNNSSAPGLTMGQSTTQQTVPGVRVDVSNIKGTTRFNDLEQSIQTEMENCDMMIQRFMAHASEIRGFMAAHGGDLEQLTTDVNWLQRKYEGVKTTLDEDIVTMAHLKDLVKSDADIAKMAFAGADQLKLPAHYHQTWLTRGGSGNNTTNGSQDRNVEDVLTLFSNEADRLKELHQFQVQKIKEMEQHMPGVEHGLYERVRALRDQTQLPAFNMVLDLLETIKMMGDKIYEAADAIVDVREKLTKLQRQYPTK
ncbi:nucleoporin NUP49/NSP49 [Colletotrichum graminicola]|nr:nucleoporin NUP49/NSP49 [Colletotrichum graminicola]